MPTFPHADTDYMPEHELSPALKPLVIRHAPGDPPMVPVAEDVPKKAEPVYVFLNHGRWIIQCPDCPGAVLAPYSDRRFFCPYCFNAKIGAHYRKVVWPDDTKIEQIETAVGVRPEENKNWEVIETVKFLQEENKLHVREML